MLLGAATVAISASSCYSAGASPPPPAGTLSFPVALATSSDDSGNAKVLYAVNSDFDLEYSDGTLQSYDLGALRRDAIKLIAKNLSGAVDAGACATMPRGGGAPLGESCAPPVPSTNYLQDTAVIGAFASGVQIAPIPSAQQEAPGSGPQERIFIPVRGDGTMTWADVSDPGAPFQIDCGQGPDGRCDAEHREGSDPNQEGNTRHTTMPGDPFGIALSEDQTAVVITHETDTKVSLLSAFSGYDLSHPTMQFVLDGMPSGGVGIAAVPHDPDAPVSPCEKVGDAPNCARPAFLETSRAASEIDLVRYYDDDGSSLHRPFLQREAAYPLASNAVGTDSRGIVIDPTPRLACKAQPGADPQACAETYPARVFFASRTPPALGIGTIGGTPPLNVGPYDPDLFVLAGNVPLPNGPSNVYLAPIVDANGTYALRVFIVCFDSGQIVVYNPGDSGVLGAEENHIDVGPGPFAMAFDPFSIADVAAHAPVPVDNSGSRKYRFAYVASFTQSFVQMIDLDNSQPTAETFEHVVFTLGQPTPPMGQ
jgi:hypothetical protein